MARKGNFGASLTPFGTGRLNLDDAYRIDPTTPEPAAPEPEPVMEPPAPPSAVAAGKPVVKGKPKVKPKPGKGKAPIKAVKKIVKPVAKKIVKPVKRLPIITGAKKAARGIGAARRSGPTKPTATGWGGVTGAPRGGRALPKPPVRRPAGRGPLI